MGKGVLATGQASPEVAGPVENLGASTRTDGRVSSHSKTMVEERWCEERATEATP